jgi:hypothetical protein
VEVSRVGVEDGHLILAGLYNSRIAVSNMSDVVISIQIFDVFLIVEILHRSTNDFYRILVSKTQVSSEKSFS